MASGRGRQGGQGSRAPVCVPLLSRVAQPQRSLGSPVHTQRGRHGRACALHPGAPASEEGAETLHRTALTGSLPPTQSQAVSPPPPSVLPAGFWGVSPSPGPGQLPAPGPTLCAEPGAGKAGVLQGGARSRAACGTGLRTLIVNQTVRFRRNSSISNNTPTLVQGQPWGTPCVSIQGPAGKVTEHAAP